MVLVCSVSKLQILNIRTSTRAAPCIAPPACLPRSLCPSTRSARWSTPPSAPSQSFSSSELPTTTSPSYATSTSTPTPSPRSPTWRLTSRVRARRQHCPALHALLPARPSSVRPSARPGRIAQVPLSLACPVRRTEHPCSPAPDLSLPPPRPPFPGTSERPRRRTSLPHSCRCRCLCRSCHQCRRLAAG
jgi:hypothetical protein